MRIGESVLCEFLLFAANRASDSLSSLEGGSNLAFIGTTPVGRHPIRLVAGQFNANQHANADVVSLDQHAGELSLCLGQGDGHFVCAPL